MSARTSRVAGRPRARSGRRSSRCPRAPAPTLLTVASSATRCRVSWTSRAFSSATLRLPPASEQALVGIRERMLAVDVLERDHPVARPRRSTARRATTWPVRRLARADCRTLGSAVHVLVDQRAARGTPSRACGSRSPAWLVVEALAPLDRVGEAEEAARLVHVAMSRPGRRRSRRSLSPTRSKIAWGSSSPAIASWTLLIIASSAFRCRVSSIARARESAAPTCWPTKASRSLSSSVYGRPSCTTARPGRRSLALGLQRHAEPARLLRDDANELDFALLRPVRRCARRG